MTDITSEPQTTLQKRQPSLDKIFRPNNVAVIGATEKAGSVGRTIIKNLVTNPFGGTIFPVNPGRPNVLGIQTYPSVTDIPVDIDLAVIVTPARTVPGIIDECIAKGVEGCIIISAGFKETGEDGAELERRIMEKARGRMRHHRAELPRCHAALVRHERHLRRLDGAAGQRRLYQPVRCHLHRRARLELR